MRVFVLFFVLFALCFCGELSIKSRSSGAASDYNSNFYEPKYSRAQPPRFDESSQDYQKGSYEHDKKRSPADLYGDYPSQKVR